MRELALAYRKNMVRRGLVPALPRKGEVEWVAWLARPLRTGEMARTRTGREFKVGKDNYWFQNDEGFAVKKPQTPKTPKRVVTPADDELDFGDDFRETPKLSEYVAEQKKNDAVTFTEKSRGRPGRSAAEHDQKLNQIMVASGVKLDDQAAVSEVIRAAKSGELRRMNPDKRRGLGRRLRRAALRVLSGVATVGATTGMGAGAAFAGIGLFGTAGMLLGKVMGFDVDLVGALQVVGAGVGGMVAGAGFAGVGSWADERLLKDTAQDLLRGRISYGEAYKQVRDLVPAFNPHFGKGYQENERTDMAHVQLDRVLKESALSQNEKQATQSMLSRIFSAIKNGRIGRGLNALGNMAAFPFRKAIQGFKKLKAWVQANPQKATDYGLTAAKWAGFATTFGGFSALVGGYAMQNEAMVQTGWTMFGSGMATMGIGVGAHREVKKGRAAGALERTKRMFEKGLLTKEKAIEQIYKHAHGQSQRYNYLEQIGADPKDPAGYRDYYDLPGNV